MTVPVDVGRPAIVGVYYGTSKDFPVNSFLMKLMEDLKQLHPCNRGEYGNTRAFSVRVRAIIADAKQRAEIKGTKFVTC